MTQRLRAMKRYWNGNRNTVVKMPYNFHHYCPPAIYVETMARRQRDAARTAQRQARNARKRIADTIDEHGERMSDEGRGLLLGLAETFQKIAQTLRR